MSGIVAGIAKAFTAVGSAAARVGSAVAGVGASVFTSGAATGAGSMASGLFGQALQKSGGGVLGNMLSGAFSQAIPGALMGGVAGMASGQGFMKGAVAGGLGGAVMGASGKGFGDVLGSFGGDGVDTLAGGAGVDNMTTGSVGGNASRGLLNTGSVAGGIDADVNGALAATQPTAAGQIAQSSVTEGPKGGGLMGFLQSETGAGVLSGLGQGMMEKAKIDALAAENQKNRDATLANQQRITNSYNVGSAPLNRGRFVYDPAIGRVVTA
jgi:hypothetical protein